MAMTVPQKRYFIKRIDEILAIKVLEVPSVQMKKDESMLKMFKDNKIVLKSPTAMREMVIKKMSKSQNYPYYGSSITLNDLMKNWDEKEKQYDESFDQAHTDRNAEIAMLEDKATHVKDVAMFGSEEIAHTMLKEFMEYTP